MLRGAVGVSVGWIGISMIADGLPAVLLPHRLLAEGDADAAALGLTTLVAIGVAALLQPLAGRWSDRAGRFPVITAGSLVAVAGLVLVISPGGALPGTVVTLAGVSVAQAGHQALLPDRIPPSWRGRAGGLKSAFDVLGAMAGFVLLAALLGNGEPVMAAAALGLALVAGFGLAWVTIGRDQRRERGGLGARVPTRSPFRLDLRAHAPLLRLIAARFFFLLGIYVVGRFLLLFAAARFGLDADAAGEQAGAALALLALVTVLASLPSGWLADRVGRRPLMLAGGGLAAVGIALLPLAASMPLLLVFGGLMALGSAAFGSASWAMLGDLTASPDAGRLLGIANLGTAGAAAGAGAFGVLIDVAGFDVTFALAAACSLAGGLLAWRLTDAVLPAPRLAGSVREAA